MNEIAIAIAKIRSGVEQLTHALPSDELIVGSALFELDHAALSILYRYVWNAEDKAAFLLRQEQKGLPFDPNKYVSE